MLTAKKWLLTVFVTCCLPLWGCIEEAPLTGRSQLMLLPASQLNALSVTEYKTFLSSNKLSSNQSQTQMVKRVGGRIRTAVEKYFADKDMEASIRDYNWQFELVDSPEVNAWAMPGGRVVVYSGLLPVTKDETGLAVVLGHEIAHAVAQHGRERMSQQLLVSLGGVALNQALKDKPDKTKAIFMTAYGAGATVGYTLRYSRIQEKEADHLGLIFMAMAGYDPEQAVPFWTRMANNSEKGANPPEFLSTHPSDSTRIREIRKMLPEAKSYYKK